MTASPHYDIIGDVHGRFDKLAVLMDRMGYRREGETFIPPAAHRALFLGDVIDTKPGHAVPGGVRATLRAAKAMCDAGHALCLMGNHELNAIYYHSPGPDGRPLREHNHKNVRMHEGTLADFPDHQDPAAEWRTVWLPWFKHLPFFLDLGGLRAVHATWHPAAIGMLDGRTLDDEALFLAACDKRQPAGEALDTLLKGVEIRLPDGIHFTDHTGVTRNDIRVCWWQLPDLNIGYDALVFPANPAIPNDPVRMESFARIPGYPLDAPPLFFGHYYKPANSPLAPERHNVACLDHSAATNGPLVAYRWNGESTIQPGHYLSSR